MAAKKNIKGNYDGVGIFDATKRRDGSEENVGRTQ